jgi:hypothetical protein
MSEGKIIACEATRSLAASTSSTSVLDCCQSRLHRRAAKSNHHNAIFVVIGQFSMYAHFLPLAHPFTALQVAQVYINHIYRLHGLPHALISDRDSIFMSSLWLELFKMSDNQLIMSSSYHPQTNGQIERLNQCLETYLRCAVHASPAKWFYCQP